MKITGLSASNFLSYAPGQHAFFFKDLSDDLTIVVGPNGHGKTNVFRLVQVILNALKKQHIVTESLQKSVYISPYGITSDERRVELSMDLVFDDPQERELLNLFVQTALMALGPYINTEVDSQVSTVKPFSMKPDRYIQFCNWVQETTPSTKMDPIIKGTIKLRADVKNSDKLKLLFEISSCNLHFTVDLRNGNITSETTYPQRGYKSFAASFLDGLDSGMLEQLFRFLNGDDVLFPNMDSFTWDNVVQTMNDLGRGITTSISMGELVPGDVPNCWFDLMTILGKERHQNDSITISDVFKHLVCQSVLLIDNWRMCDEEMLNLNEINNIELLNSGKLASFLFGLKNGNQQQQDRFKKIQDTFEVLSGDLLDVELTQKHAYSSNEVKHYVSIHINHMIPLQNSGTGRTQLVLLSTAAHLDHKVLLLDEPNAFLHPSLQVRVRDMWRETSAQKLVITHSPYMVTLENIERVRRIYMDSETGSSCVTPWMNTEQAVQAGFSKYMRQTDDALFLFAKCVIIVEGFHEVMALPIWFDKWCHDKHQTTGEFLGVHFVNAAGKNRVMGHARMMDALSIPWIGLYDADVLSDSHNENKNILKSWEDAEVVDKGTICLGDKELLKRAPLGNRRQLFFTGEDLDGKWEKLAVYKDHLEEVQREVGGNSPAISRYLAEKYPCPEEFCKMFERVFEFAADRQNRYINR